MSEVVKAAALPEPSPALAAETRAVYERNAARFDAERSKTLFERGWLDRFLSALPEEGAILDLGCGSGRPIAEYLMARGRRVTGVDFSNPMLELARAYFPDGDWRHADMRDLDMRTADLAERFAGIVGWGSFFHLTPTEQRAALPGIARHLAPGGALMLTVGPGAGEVTGRVGDDAVYHSSLSPEEYGVILAAEGVEVTDFKPNDPDCGGFTILFARHRTTRDSLAETA